MPATLPESPPPPTPSRTRPDATAHEPDDWPALWREMLLVRAPGSAPEPAPGPRRLVPSADQGWMPSAPCSAASAALFAVYKPLLDARQATSEPGRAAPWCLAQLGQSLDGCVATASGDSYYVTGPASLLHLHRLRALCDGVLVGAGTVVADNPRLTTRLVPGPHPLRVLLDPGARLDGRAQALHDPQAPTWWLCDSEHAALARTRLSGAAGGAPPAAEVLGIDGLLDRSDPLSAFDPARVLAALAGLGLRMLLVEGGGRTVSRFLAAGVLDRLHLVIAPVLIGDGRRGLQGPLRSRMADCPRPASRQFALGQDMLWDLDLRASPPLP